MSQASGMVKDGRVLAALARRYNIVYDKDYKYVTKTPDPYIEMEYKGQKYVIRYFSGSFYPYVVRLE